MTVDELIDRITLDELLDWQAFYRVEPFGEEWKRTSYIASMIGNAAGGKRGGRPFTPDDFMPVKNLLAFTAKRQSGKEMLSIFKMMAEATKADNTKKGDE